MPFSVASDFDGLVAEISRIQSGLADTKRRSLVSIGYRLVAFEKQHFQQLSDTGSSNGVTWPAPSPATLARRKTLQRQGILAKADPEDIGVLSGQLGNSFRFVVKGDSVHLTNIDPKAGYFAAKRPLYPQTMPAEWKAASETILQRKLDQLSNQ